MSYKINKSLFFTTCRIWIITLLACQWLMQWYMYPIIQTVSAQELNKVSEESIEDSPSQKEETMLLNDNNSEISEVVDTQNEENELEQSNKDQQDVDNSQEESDEAIDDEVISWNAEKDQDLVVEKEVESVEEDSNNDLEEIETDEVLEIQKVSFVPRNVSSAWELQKYALQWEIEPIFDDNGKVTKAVFKNTFIFNASNGVEAILEQGNSVSTHEWDEFDIHALEIIQPSQEELEGMPVSEIYWSTIFWIPGQHVVFEQPVKLKIPVSKLDGEIVEVFVKHEGEEIFWTVWLTTQKDATCEWGVSSSESNNAQVVDGMIIIYTCGASTYGVWSSNSPATCGNGIIDTNEACDDGNQVSGDGCVWNEWDTLWCEIENGYVCSNDSSWDSVCDTAGVGSVQSCLSQVPSWIENGKYWTNQVFDVQRSPAFPTSWNTFTLSSMTTPYSAITRSQYTIWADQYIEFYYNGWTCNVDADNVGIQLFNGDGSLAADIAYGWSIYGIWDEWFLHVSDGLWFGTFVSNLEWFSNWDSLSYIPRTAEAICLDLSEYPANPNPLWDWNITNICDLIQECGDWIVQVWEECDDWNSIAWDGCDDIVACSIESWYECSWSPSSCSVSVVTSSALVCPWEKADIWFGIDESGSVSAQEFNDGLDFMYQVSDAFDYDSVSGMQWWAYGWWTSVNNNVIPVTEDFGDSGDSGLIQNSNVTVDNDGKWIRELYGARTANGGTNLALATSHMASLLNWWVTNWRRTGVEQVTVIITDASSSQLTNDSSWGWNAWIQAAQDLRNAWWNIVLVITEAAYTSYYNGQSTSVVDQVVWTGWLLIAVPTYAEASDPAKAHIENLTEAICIMACDINDGTRDCDSDGVLNASDPNPIVAYAGADTGTVIAWSWVVIDLIANDDFEAVNGITIADTWNWTAGWSLLFTAEWVLTYTSLVSEAWTTVTIEYEVCTVSWDTCASALVSIEVQCDVNDLAQDCDEDGTPNGTDPNPWSPIAQNDGQFIAIPWTTNNFDIIANDDFIAGASIIVSDTGNWTAIGSIRFDELIWTVSYTPDTSEIWNTVTIEYQVCYLSSWVCDTAIVTILAGGPCIDPSSDPTWDEDGDGIINSEEIVLWDSDDDWVSNCEDRDDDNDGILSIDEGSQDTDSDGTPNYLDDDSDWDSVLDVIEAWWIDSNWDGTLGGIWIVVNSEGVIVSDSEWWIMLPVLIDTDNDTVYDPYDHDDDGDGCLTAYEVELSSNYLSSSESCESWSSSSIGSFTLMQTEHWAADDEKSEDTLIQPNEEEPPLAVEKVLEHLDEEVEIDELPLEELITCAEVLSSYRESSSCYYQDGVFNGSQRNDISTSTHTDKIVAMTNECYYHGPSDTQTTFRPDAFVSQWELIKIAVRMWRMLPKTFSHFDAKEEERFVPYFEAAKELWMLEWTIISENTVYEAAKVKDIALVLWKVLEYHDLVGSDIDIAWLIPDSYAYKDISREDFASMVAVVHEKLYWLTQQSQLPDDVQTCLDMIDITSNSACEYWDGSFDGNQWSDIAWLTFEGAVKSVTDGCLIHGWSDTQSRYEPFAPATNWAWVKIAARMWGFMPQWFNHFDAETRYLPYFDVLQKKWIVDMDIIEVIDSEMTLYDLTEILMKVLVSSSQEILSLEEIQSLIPQEYSTLKVNRSWLAVITELFRSYLQ